MAARNSDRRGRPAISDEGRETQLISHAYDLAERQLRDGSASAQVISHFLKAGSSRDQLEREKIQRENHLLSVKAEQMESVARQEGLFEEAIKAMRTYSGHPDPDEGEYYED
jgi:hypothetical protein